MGVVGLQPAQRRKKVRSREVERAISTDGDQTKRKKVGKRDAHAFVKRFMVFYELKDRRKCPSKGETVKGPVKDDAIHFVALSR